MNMMRHRVFRAKDNIIPSFPHTPKGHKDIQNGSMQMFRREETVDDCMDGNVFLNSKGNEMTNVQNII